MEEGKQTEKPQVQQVSSDHEAEILSGHHAQHLERNFSFIAALGMAFGTLIDVSYWTFWLRCARKPC